MTTLKAISNTVHTHTRRVFTTATIAMLLFLTGCASEYHLEITIGEDGTVDFNTRYSLPREQVEQMVRWSDPTHQMSRHYYGGEDENWEDIVEEGVVIEEQAPQANPMESAEPLTDDQVIDGFTRVSQERSPLKGIEGVTQEVKSVTLDEESVHMQGATHFDSLEMLIKHGTYYWQSGGIDAVSITKDEQGNLVLSAGVDEEVKERFSQMRRMFKSQKFSGSVRITLPGQIISSTLPNTEANQTWIEVSSENSDSLDQIEDLLGESLQIVAAPAALDLSTLPLDSKDLAVPVVHSSPDEPDPYENLPITDAPEGYYAEAETLTTSSIVILPGAKEKLGRRLDNFSHEYDNSATVAAKLYPPQNAKILSIGEVSVETAVDNLGNPIDEYSDPGISYSYRRSYGSDEEGDSASFQVKLDLPAADAEAIEEVSGSLIAHAFDDWSEHRVERVRANPGRVIDLNDILPGATLTIKRYKRHIDKSSRERLEGRFELELNGPPEVAAIKFAIEIPGSDNINTYDSMDQSRIIDGKTRRTVDVRYNDWGDHTLGPDAVDLIIKYPTGMRRERVPFTLEALDIF